MNKRANVVALVAFFIVVAFVAGRLSTVHATWTEWSDFAHGLAELGLFVVSMSAILVVILGTTNLFWKAVRPRASRAVGLESKHWVAGHRLDALKFSVLSVVLTLFTWRVTQMRTPGWWVVGTLADWINAKGEALPWWLIFLLPFTVDAAVWVAILWGIYLLWQNRRPSFPK
jgi:hypothetical protein